jgi:hypothetical protein
MTPRTIADAIQARLADALDALSEIDAMVEADAGRLPPLLLARALVRLDTVAGPLARLRKRSPMPAGTLWASRLPRTRERGNNATGRAF